MEADERTIPVHVQTHAVENHHVDASADDHGSPLDRLAALAEVVVDGGDPVAGPAQGDGPLGQGVLPRRRLAVIEDLLRGRLADVDDGRAVVVPRPELGGAEVGHDPPPGGRWPRGAGRGVGRADRSAASADRPGGGPTPGVGRSAVDASSGAGERCGGCRTCGSSGEFPAAPPAPFGQLEQRRGVYRFGKAYRPSSPCDRVPVPPPRP